MAENATTTPRAGSLNVHAASFVPQTRAFSAPPVQASTAGATSQMSTALERRLPKLQTVRSSLYKSLDQVPFTPTQGICTPSPTNMAAYWYQAHYGFADPFGMYASAWSPQHLFLSQMSPGSPMFGSSSLASVSSMFHMSQSSGSPNFSYPYSHWYWPQAPSSPQAAPFMQAQYAASHTFSSGSPGSSNSSSGASPNSPGSPVPAYSPTAVAAAAAAGVYGHSVYNMSQMAASNHNMHPGYHYAHESMPGWQQGFIQGVGYGQPMRAYRSPSRTPSRSPPKDYTDTPSAYSQHASDMQTGSSQHMSESASSSQNPDGKSPLSRASNSQGQHTGRVPESPFGAFANSPPGMVRISPNGASASGPSDATELRGICRGLGRWEDPPQQLTDLAELMQSYGFPTTGWGDEEEPDRAGSHRDAASNMVVDQESTGAKTVNSSGQGAALRIPAPTPYKLNARQRRTLRRALDRAKQAVTASVAQ